jgi:hypothetical protein
MFLFSAEERARVYANNPIVAYVTKAGGDEEDMLVAFDRHFQTMTDHLMRLEAIAPRRFQVGGVEYVYRCPDDMIPLTNFSTTEWPCPSRP